MTRRGLTLDDLTRAMRQAAGQDDAVDLGADVLDLAFAELGYDSVMLLETVGWIEREHGIRLADSTLEDARTPRALLAVINEQLGAGQAA